MYSYVNESLIPIFNLFNSLKILRNIKILFYTFFSDCLMKIFLFKSVLINTTHSNNDYWVQKQKLQPLLI